MSGDYLISTSINDRKRRCEIVAANTFNAPGKHPPPGSQAGTFFRVQTPSAPHLVQNISTGGHCESKNLAATRHPACSTCRNELSNRCRYHPRASGTDSTNRAATGRKRALRTIQWLITLSLTSQCRQIALKTAGPTGPAPSAAGPTGSPRRAVLANRFRIAICAAGSARRTRTENESAP